MCVGLRLNGMAVSAAHVVSLLLCLLAVACAAPDAAGPPPQPAPAATASGPGNAPLTVAVTVSPERPVAGEPVTFDVVAEDPDAEVGAVGCLSYHWFGDEQARPGRCVAGCVSPRGDEAAARPAPGHLEEQLTHTYDEPGRYTAVFHYSSNVLCVHNPYGSEGEAEVVVHVRP